MRKGKEAGGKMVKKGNKIKRDEKKAKHELI